MNEPFPADKEYLKETFEYDSDSDLGDEIDEDVERLSASTNRDIAIENSEGENHNMRGKKYGRIIVLSMGAHKTFVNYL